MPNQLYWKIVQIRIREVRWLFLKDFVVAFAKQDLKKSRQLKAPPLTLGKIYLKKNTSVCIFCDKKGSVCMETFYFVFSFRHFNITKLFWSVNPNCLFVVSISPFFDSIGICLSKKNNKLYAFILIIWEQSCFFNWSILFAYAQICLETVGCLLPTHFNMFMLLLLCVTFFYFKLHLMFWYIGPLSPYSFIFTCFWFFSYLFMF